MKVLIIYEDQNIIHDSDIQYIYKTLSYYQKYDNINISTISLCPELLKNLDCMNSFRKLQNINSQNMNSYFSNYLPVSYFCNIASKIENCNLLIIVTSHSNTSHDTLKLLFKNLSYIWLPHKQNEKLKNIIATIISSDSSSVSRKLAHFLSSTLISMNFKDIFHFNLENQLKHSAHWNNIKLTLIAHHINHCLNHNYNIPYILKFLNNMFYFKIYSLKYFILSSLKVKNKDYLMMKTSKIRAN